MMTTTQTGSAAQVNETIFRKGRAVRRLVVREGSEVVELFNGVTRREITLRQARNLQVKLLDKKSGWSLVSAA